MFPPIKYEKENFIQQAKQLKAGFDFNTPSSLFLSNLEQ
jgi:hypothetical protein